MNETAEIAYRLLQVEQQLAAYQKLHQDELVELWRILNDCKTSIVRLTGREDQPAKKDLAKDSKARE